MDDSRPPRFVAPFADHLAVTVVDADHRPVPVQVDLDVAVPAGRAVVPGFLGLPVPPGPVVPAFSGGAQHLENLLPAHSTPNLLERWVLPDPAGVFSLVTAG